MGNSISYHPDIVIHPINHNTIITSPQVFDYYDNKLKGLGIKIIKGATYLDKSYPSDIAYNVGRVGNLALHKLRYTDVLLISPGHIELKNEKYGFIGGATGHLDKKTMILSGHLDNHPDKSNIEKFIKDKGIEILYISKEPIRDLGTIICLKSK